MNKRIVFETADIIARMFTKPNIEMYFSSFDIPQHIIDKHNSTKKPFCRGVMIELFDSGSDNDKKIIHDIVENISCDENVDKFNYYPEEKDEYEKSLTKLRKLLFKDGYDEEDGRLIQRPSLIDEIDEKYEFIILNLRDYGLDDLAETFKDAIRNYATDTRSSLNDLRSVLENLISHIVAANGETPSNNRQNMEKLKNIGVLKEPSSSHPNTECDFSYNLYQMLSNWGTHHSRTPVIEHDYVFSTSILYLDFLIKRINESGVNTS